MPYYPPATGGAGTGDMLLGTGQTVTAAKTFNAGTLLDKGSQVFDVKAYGALGDGSTDDATAIQSAITAAAVAGGTVFLPAGTFIVGTELSLASSSITVEGVGPATVIKVKNTANIRSAIAITGSTINIRLKNFAINGNKANQSSGSGIYIKNTANALPTDNQFDHLYVANCKNDGIQIDAASANGSMYFLRVHSRGNDGIGFNLKYPSLTDSIFDSCIADTNGLDGFYIGGVDNHFSNCKTYYNGSAGGNYHGYHIAGYNNYFDTCEAQDEYQSGFYGNGSDGDATYGNQYCTFVNCSGDSNGINGGTTYACGLQAINAKGWQVIGGTWMTRPYPTQSQRIGISLQGTSNNCRVMNIAGEGNTSSLYSNTASGTGNTLYGLKDNVARISLDAGTNSFEWDNAPELFWNQANPNISLYSASDNNLSVINTGGGKATFDVQNQMTFGYGYYLGVSPSASYPSGTHKLIETGWNGSQDQVDIYTPGGSRAASILTLKSDGSTTVNGDLTIADAKNIGLNTTTGTKIGTATGQKLAFYNSTPIVQPTGDIASALSGLGLVASPTIASRITKRALTITQSATPTINTDITDVAHITGLAQAITSMTTNLSGTPVHGDTLRIDITDNGTARAITWGATFEAGAVALPTTTVISTRLDVGFFWNTVTSKWRCMASG